MEDTVVSFNDADTARFERRLSRISDEMEFVYGGIAKRLEYLERTTTQIAKDVAAIRECLPRLIDATEKTSRKIDAVLTGYELVVNAAKINDE